MGFPTIPTRSPGNEHIPHRVALALVDVARDLCLLIAEHVALGEVDDALSVARWLVRGEGNPGWYTSWTREAESFVQAGSLVAIRVDEAVMRIETAIPVLPVPTPHLQPLREAALLAERLFYAAEQMLAGAPHPVIGGTAA